MELESQRFQKVSDGQEKVCILMDEVLELAKRYSLATDKVAASEELNVNDLMIYNKSVFDLCNDILSELHRLRHYVKAPKPVFSEKSFAERILAESLPLTTSTVAQYVMDKLKKVQASKSDVILSKRPPDSLVDVSRATEEFVKQYNFMAEQSIDETTDILMARLLVETVQYFRK